MIANCQNQIVLQTIYDQIQLLLGHSQKQSEFNISKTQVANLRKHNLITTDASKRVVQYLQPFLEVLHSDSILKINQGRIRIILKQQLLRFLMQHYAKFKTSVEGASLLIENDLQKFDE